MNSLQLTTDPVEFRRLAADFLAANPLEATIIAVALDRLAAGEQLDHAPGVPMAWFAAARDGDRVTGLAMRTGRFPAYLLGLSPAQGRDLAKSVLASGEIPSGANGDLDPTGAFCEAVILPTAAPWSANARPDCTGSGGLIRRQASPEHHGPQGNPTSTCSPAGADRLPVHRPG
ncbi:MAG: hypothetical protein V9G19_25985 [Tetrasphaera sp.]